MHSQIWFVALLATIAVATTKTTPFVISSGQSTTLAFDWQATHVPLSTVPEPMTTNLLTTNGGHINAQQLLQIIKRHTPETVQQPVTVSQPRATAVEAKFIVPDETKYLPKPGPMPTTTPHHSLDMNAVLVSKVDEYKLSLLRSSILSHSKALKSDNVQLSSALKSMHDAQKKKKNAANKAAATTKMTLLGLAVSLVAATGFDGLALVL